MPQKKSRKKTKSVSIRFRDGQLERFRAAAAADGRSLNSFVIRACQLAAARATTTPALKA